MNELRWILLGCGLALIVALYFWGRRSNRPASGTDARPVPPVVDTPQIDYSDLEIPPYLRTTGEAPDPQSVRIADVTEPLDRNGDEESEFAEATPLPVESTTPAQHARPGSRHDEVDETPVRRTAVERHTSRREPSFGSLTPAGETPGRTITPRRTEPGIGSRESSRPAERHEGEVEAHSAASAGPAGPATSGNAVHRKIFAVRLVAPSGERYEGTELLARLQALELQHGKYGIFHALDPDGESVFSVASMVEPGSFDLDSMSQARFPGLTLFTLVPGSRPGPQAIDAMLECAHRLQTVIGGSFQDERGMPLVEARLEAMRAEARRLDPRAGVASRSVSG